jgi:hypothetical protein
VPLGLRVTLSIKEQLDKCARDSGRSQSQEAEIRLENSFRDQNLAVDALRLAFGPELLAFMLLIGRSTRNIGAAFDLFAGSGIGEASAWFHSPFAFDQAMAAVARIGDQLRPEGNGAPPDALSEMPDFAKGLGQREADRVINAVRGKTADIPPLRDLASFGAMVRELLGGAADRLDREEQEGRTK